MAQVKRNIIKAQEGAEVPEVKSKPTYGKFHMAGKTLEGDLGYSRLMTADREGKGGMFTKAALSAYQAGHDVWSGNDGSFRVTNSSGEDITDQFISGKSPNTDDKLFWKRVGATVNSKKHQDRVNNELLMGINMDPEKVETPDNRTELRKGSGWFTTVKGADGKDIYDENGVLNRDNEEKIREIIAYTLGDEKAMNDKYKYSAWSDNDRTTLRNYANEFSSSVDADGNNTYAQSLIDAIRSGKELTADQLHILKLMGFDKNSNSGSTEGSADSNNHSNPYELDNIDRDLAENLGITGIKKGKDENGNDIWTVEGDQFQNSTWDLSGFGNIFGNTAFKNGWISNGRLYADGDEQTNNALASRVARYVGNNATNFDDWWEEANNSGVRFYGDTASGGSSPFETFNYNTQYDSETEGVIWDYMRNHNLANTAIRDVTAAYTPNGWTKLYAYIDPKDRTSRGFYNPHYFNEKGEEVANPGTQLRFPGTARGNFGISTADTSNTAINGMFVHHTYTNSNDNMKMTVMRDGQGNYSIYRAKPDGTPMNPIKIDPSRLDEFKNMMKTGQWAKWSEIEKMGKAASTAPSTETTKIGGAEYKYENGHTYIKGKDGQWNLYRKEGGTIDWNKLQKLQYGGYLNNVKKEDVVVDNSKVSDITKTHALDGSDGGLTEAEKLQVTGALADLAGVGLSFAPGIAGGIAGGITGLTGTAFKFAGDVKRDGLDWGDVGRGLLNLAFDVAAVPASLLPAGDNVIKGAKFVKGIKTLANTVGLPKLLKYMGTLNLGTSVTNTIVKIANGEKYTSEDLTNLAQGLAGGIVAGKQWGKQIGDAKLASKLSGKVATKNNVDFSEFTEVGGKRIENSKIDSIVKKAKGNASEIEAALKKELNLADDAKIKLEDFGINKGEKNIWQRAFKKDAKSIYEKPEKQEGKSTWHYMINGSERAQALGNNKLFYQKKHNNLLGNLSEEEYRLLMARGAGAGNHTISGAVRRAAMENPNKFNFKFTGTKTTSAPWQFGWRNKFKTVAEPETIKKQDQQLLLPAPKQEVLTPDYIIKPTENGPQIILLPGGKKMFALPEASSIKFNRPIVTQANIPSTRTLVTPPPKEWVSNQIFQNLSKSNLGRLILPAARPINQIRFTPTVEAMPIRNHSGEVEVLTKSGVRKMVKKAEGGLIPKFELGGFTGKAFSINKNLIPATLDLGQAISSQLALNRAYKADTDALWGLKAYNEQAVQLNTPRLDLSPIEHKYTAARNNFLSSIGPSAYSDLALRAAVNNSTAQQMLNLGMQEGAEISNGVNSYNQEKLAIDNQNAANRIQTANKNLNYQTQLNYQIDSLSGQKIRDEQANIWQPLSQQFRQNMRENTNRFNTISNQFELSKLQNNQRLETKNFFKDVYSLYNSDTNPNKGEFEDWLSTNSKAYAMYDKLKNSDEYNNLMEEQKKAYFNLLRNQKPILKSGGSVYKHKTVQEELAINGDKISKKAVQKASDNLSKLLQQLLRK